MENLLAFIVLAFIYYSRAEETVLCTPENLSNYCDHGFLDCTYSFTTETSSGFCMCDEGYSGKTCQYENGKADIAVILDSSPSVSPVEWEESINYITNMVSSIFSDESLSIQLAAVNYSSHGNILWNLTDGFSADAILQLIDEKLEFFNDTLTTNAYIGLETVQEQVLTAEYGARSDARKFCFFFTDGVTTEAHTKTIPDAQKLRDMGSEFYVVQVGPKNETNKEVLNSLVSTQDHKIIMEEAVVGEEFKFLTDKIIDSGLPPVESSGDASGDASGDESGDELDDTPIGQLLSSNELPDFDGLAMK